MTTHQLTHHRPDSDVLSKLARPGLVAHAVLYVTIGLLALQVALNGGEEQADGKGALETLAEQPFGTALLLLMVVGLAALALWRAAQAVWGDPVSGSETSDRLLYGGKAVVYASLAISAVGVLAGSGSGSGSDQQAKSWTATAMEWPGGRFLVAAVGLAVIAYGVKTFWDRAVHASFMDQMDRGEMHGGTERTVRRLGQVGYAARSVVFLLIGGFVVQAAWSYDPDGAKGLSASLQELAQSGWSPVLWLVAVGLMAFGLLSLALARYRRVA